MPTFVHDPDVRAQQIDGRAVADYTSDEGRDRHGKCPLSFCQAEPGESCVSSNGRLRSDHGPRSCDGHRTDNTAGYVVRRTLDEAGDLVHDPATPDRVGVDVYAVACEPGWGHYDKALTAARAYRSGRSYAVVDTLYRCGHRGAA